MSPHGGVLLGISCKYPPLRNLDLRILIYQAGGLGGRDWSAGGGLPVKTRAAEERLDRPSSRTQRQEARPDSAMIAADAGALAVRSSSAFVGTENPALKGARGQPVRSSR